MTVSTSNGTVYVAERDVLQSTLASTRSVFQGLEDPEAGG
jgi:hypothetical protein